METAMAWLVLLLGAGLLLWGLASLRAHDRRLGDLEERLARLADELATAGEAVLQAADARLTELEEAVAAADRRLAALQQAAPAPPPQSAPAPPPDPPQHLAVWRLHDAGRDEAAIARETGLPAGEVRLILGLRRLQRR